MEEEVRNKLWDKFAEDAMDILGPEGDNEDVDKMFELWLAGFEEGYKEGKVCE